MQDFCAYLPHATLTRRQKCVYPWQNHPHLLVALGCPHLSGLKQQDFLRQFTEQKPMVKDQEDWLLLDVLWAIYFLTS